MSELMSDKQTQFRCSMHGMLMLFKDLKDSITEEHKEVMRKTPFKHLFEAIVGNEIDERRKKDQMLYDLIGTFDKEVGKFRFGSSYYEPNRLDVKLILGIEDGTQRVGKVKSHGRRASVIGPKMFGNIGRIPASLIKEKIYDNVDVKDKIAIEDTVKLMCLLIFQSFLFSNTGSHVAWGYVDYVDTLERLNSFDWSTHILEKLMKGLKSKWSHPTQVTGCTMLLLYWFCEHSTRMKEIFNGDNEESRDMSNEANERLSVKWIPRMKKWKLTQVERMLNKGYLDGLNEDMFNDANLTPTSAEESMLQSLKDECGTEDVLVVDDSDLEDTKGTDKFLIRTIDGKSKSSLALIKKGHSHGSTISSERNPRTGKGRVVEHAEEGDEDWGGPSFSLFQNESQDILADVIARDEDGSDIEREKERDSGVDKVNSDKETSKESEDVGTEERHSLHNEKTKSIELKRMKKEQMKQLEELVDKVAQLEEEKEAQSLIMRNMQKRIFDAEKINRKKEDESAASLQEISILQGENQQRFVSWSTSKTIVEPGFDSLTPSTYAGNCLKDCFASPKIESFALSTAALAMS